MEEREIRLDEISKLETFLEHSQILAGPVRSYVAHRRRAIDVDLPSVTADVELSPEELRQKAIDYIKSKGYDQAAAEKLVDEWGPEGILAPATGQPPVVSQPGETVVSQTGNTVTAAEVLAEVVTTEAPPPPVEPPAADPEPTPEPAPAPAPAPAPEPVQAPEEH